MPDPKKMQVTLKAAGGEDLELIRQLAIRIWNQHYTSIIPRAQIDYMLELMYSAKSLSEQVGTKGHRFYFVLADGAACGFIALRMEDDGTCFIHKFYIDQDLASQGIGTLAFRQLEALTGARAFRLTVNRQNYKAVNFYFKNGFTIERVADFDIGNGFVMNDFVMIRKERK